MATIFRATDHKLGREVAVKVLRPEFGADAQFVERFRHEAQAAASLSHPNIVQVYDYGTDPAGPYIVMEQVSGGDLAAVLGERGALPPTAVARTGQQIADALAAAHARGLVHRDIKPGNILLSPDGRVQVADFGIAQAAARSPVTATGITLGSVLYFSPEQARGDTATPASDIYSLGLVMYEMLTGQRAFSGDSPAAVAVARLSGGVPSPMAVRAEMPPALDAIVRWCLATDPAARPSAPELSTALARFITDPTGAAAYASAAGVVTLAGGPAAGRPGGPATHPGGQWLCSWFHRCRALWLRAVDLDGRRSRPPRHRRLGHPALPALQRHRRAGSLTEPDADAHAAAHRDARLRGHDTGRGGARRRAARPGHGDGFHRAGRGARSGHRPAPGSRCGGPLRDVRPGDGDDTGRDRGRPRRPWHQGRQGHRATRVGWPQGRRPLHGRGLAAGGLRHRHRSPGRCLHDARIAGRLRGLDRSAARLDTPAHESAVRWRLATIHAWASPPLAALPRPVSPATGASPTPSPFPSQETTLVGDFLCLDLATARDHIEEAGLLVGAVIPSDPVPADSWIVHGQLPKAGESVPIGSNVDLVLRDPLEPCPGD